MRKVSRFLVAVLAVMMVLGAALTAEARNDAMVILGARDL